MFETQINTFLSLKIYHHVMAKKKGDTAGAASIVGTLLSGFLSNIAEGFLSTFFSEAKTRIDEIASHAARILLFSLTLLSAVVFALIGAVLLLEEYYYIHRGWFFIAGAAVLLFWALITKIQIEKER